MSSGGSTVLAACNIFAPRALCGLESGACPRPDGTMTPLELERVFLERKPLTYFCKIMV